MHLSTLYFPFRKGNHYRKTRSRSIVLVKDLKEITRLENDRLSSKSYRKATPHSQVSKNESKRSLIKSVEVAGVFNLRYFLYLLPHAGTEPSRALRKELNHKEKALAEVAALPILLKKPRQYGGTKRKTD